MNWLKFTLRGTFYDGRALAASSCMCSKKKWTGDPPHCCCSVVATPAVPLIQHTASTPANAASRPLVLTSASGLKYQAPQHSHAGVLPTLPQHIPARRRLQLSVPAHPPCGTGSAPPPAHRAAPLAAPRSLGSVTRPALGPSLISIVELHRLDLLLLL